MKDNAESGARKPSATGPKITHAPGGRWAVAEFRDDTFRWSVDAAAFLDTLGNRAKDAKVVALDSEKMGIVIFPV